MDISKTSVNVFLIFQKFGSYIFRGLKRNMGIEIFHTLPLKENQLLMLKNKIKWRTSYYYIYFKLFSKFF
jgi:hypothetical protein